MTRKDHADGEVVALGQACLNIALERYLQPDGDFNGTPLADFQGLTGCNWTSLQRALAALIETGKAHLHWEEVDVNPRTNRTAQP